MTREEVIEQGRREGIPPGDAGSLFDKFEELTLMVKAGEISKDELISLVAEHARSLAKARKLRALMSPNLDVIAGKIR